MKNNLVHPCNQCPFRKNHSPNWLGGVWDAHTLFEFLMKQEGRFPCHQTIGDEDLPKDQEVTSDEMSYCKGALMFLRKSCKIPRHDNELREAIEKINIIDCENIHSIPEFFEHFKDCKISEKNILI